MDDTGNAQAVSRLLYMPRIDEQGEEYALVSSQNGTFIGISRIYAMPFFLDPQALMNPHIFITGMTGSGKTYLTKNLMLKLYAVLGCMVIVIDFTGEYSEFAKLFSAECVNTKRIGKLIDDGKSMIAHMDMKGMTEQRRVSEAVSALRTVLDKMRSRARKDRQIFVILDEAWKVIGRSRPLETIIREGRKYGVGIIAASQIIGDVDVPFLGNIATFFIFRVQDRESLEILQRNYGLRDDQIALIQNLELGSCFVIQVGKSSVRNSFCIRRVIGIEAAAPVRMIIDEGMNVETSMQRFEGMVRRICGSENSAEIVSKAREKGMVRLDALISELMERGGDKRLILSELRHIGIRDDDLADAFSISLAGKADGRR